MSLLESGFGEPSAYRTVGRRRDQERLLIVNGHPDPRPQRFCAALSQACLAGALAGGREADIVALGTVFPADGDGEEPTGAFDLLRLPARLTVIFPLWLDKPPQIVTRFFEQLERSGDGRVGNRRAHVVVTMSLPAFAHRSMLRERESPRHIQHAMSLPGIEIDALNFVGSVDTISRGQREEWLHRLRRLGSGKI